MISIFPTWSTVKVRNSYWVLVQGQPPFVLTLRTSSIGDPISTPQTQPSQDPQEDFNPSDGSEALFSMYLDRVIEEDRRMVESWKGDADGMLVFVGLQTTSHTS